VVVCVCVCICGVCVWCGVCVCVVCVCVCVCVSNMAVPVVARSKGWFGSRSPAGVVESNPPWSMEVCCECCVLSGRGLCDELITRPKESY